MPNMLLEIDRVRQLVDALTDEVLTLKEAYILLENRVKELEPKKRGRPANSGN